MTLKIKRKPTSPYKRYGKKPFRYSDLHRDWLSAAKAGKEEEAEFLAAKHRAKFIYGLNAAEHEAA